MKNLLTTTALALIVATAAGAQNAATGPDTRFLDAQQQTGSMLFASDIIGSRLYATGSDFSDMNLLTPDMVNGLEDVGEVDDVLLSSANGVQALVLNIGGFLGIGERDIIVSMDEVRMLRMENDPTDVRFVISATRDEFDNAPEFDRSAYVDPVAGTAQIDESNQSTTALAGAEDANVMANEMQGAIVHDAAGEEIGRVIEAVMSEDSTAIDHLIVDVSAYSGAENDRVAVPFTSASVQQGDDGSEVRILVETPVEQLPRAAM